MKSIVLIEIFIVSIISIITAIILVIKKLRYRKNLINRTKKLLDDMIFVHNNIFLNDKENIEKDEVLNNIENIVKNLGEKLENYKLYKIQKDDIENNLYKSQILWKKIFVRYPWVYKFELYNGYTANYIEHWSTYRNVKKNSRYNQNK